MFDAPGIQIGRGQRDRLELRLGERRLANRGIQSRTANAAAACTPSTMPITDAESPIDRP